MSEKKKVIVNTPVGEAQWFKLVKPDDKFKKYSVDLIVEDTPELQQIMAKMDALIEEKFKEEFANAKPEAKRKLKKSDNKPIEPQYDSEGKETGKYKIKVRGKSEGQNKDKQVYSIPRPPLFNSAAKLISDSEAAALRVFNGSLLQVNVEMVPYNVKNEIGVTFKPKAVKIKKIQQSNADASMFGFSADEVSSEDASDSDEFSSDAPSEGGSDGEDF